MLRLLRNARLDFAPRGAVELVFATSAKRSAERWSPSQLRGRLVAPSVVGEEFTGEDKGSVRLEQGL